MANLFFAFYEISTTRKGIHQEGERERGAEGNANLIKEERNGRCETIERSVFVGGDRQGQGIGIRQQAAGVFRFWLRLTDCQQKI